MPLQRQDCVVLPTISGLPPTAESGRRSENRPIESQSAKLITGPPFDNGGTFWLNVVGSDRPAAYRADVGSHRHKLWVSLPEKHSLEPYSCGNDLKRPCCRAPHTYYLKYSTGNAACKRLRLESKEGPAAKAFCAPCEKAPAFFSVKQLAFLRRFW